MTDELKKAIANLCFIAETVAHLQGRERDILPTVDKVRDLMDAEDEMVEIPFSAYQVMGIVRCPKSMADKIEIV